SAAAAASAAVLPAAPGAEIAGQGSGTGEESTSAQDLGSQQKVTRGQGGNAATSPTLEDIQKGLSSHITVVYPCEEQHRVYVGTAEGRVIIFKCEDGFPVLRWVVNPDDISAVTCIHVAGWAQGFEAPDGEEPGLLVVGSQDGAAHIYNLANLRLAGSINIPRVIPEVNIPGAHAGEAGHGAALRHI
ncbi:unnamed protein product, partial [Polarella glacialis]